jgi:hypothetical protein
MNSMEIDAPRSASRPTAKLPHCSTANLFPYLCSMLQIGKALVSLEVIEEKFVCDLQRCKGACCVEGDSGAPLDPEERAEIDKYYPAVKHMLSKEANDSVEQQGTWLKDSDGDWVTPLTNGTGACAYTLFEDGMAKCSFEKLFFEGQIPFRKPVSCHLYPIRISHFKAYDAINYHQWDVCAPACKLGKNLKVPVYRFLKDPLIRKYGEVWYNELTVAAEAWEAAKGDEPAAADRKKRKS